VSTPSRQKGGKQEKQQQMAQLFFSHIIKDNGFVKSQNFLPASRQAGLNHSILCIHNVFK